MKIIFLLLFFINIAFSMEIIEITSDYVFDAFFSIFFYMTVIFAPLFGAIALLKN